MREGALQDWSKLLNICITPPVTDFCRSADKLMVISEQSVNQVEHALRHAGLVV